MGVRVRICVCNIISLCSRTIAMLCSVCVLWFSLQASVSGFMNHLGVTEDEALHLIGRSVTMATDAQRDFLQEQAKFNHQRVTPLIAGSVGPYGMTC